MSVVLSHPTGNANVRAALRAVSAAGRRDSFRTTPALGSRLSALGARKRATACELGDLSRIRVVTGRVTRLRHLAMHHAVTALSVRPMLYYGARAVVGAGDTSLVSRGTELVIEGYPRSANTTTVYGFLERQACPVRVAHHKHHAAQLIRAARWGIPAIALLREPRAAILSYKAFAEERRMRTGQSRRDDVLDFIEMAGAWRAFYQAVLPVRDRLLIVPFERAIGDIEGVIESLNGRFGTSFDTVPRAPLPLPAGGWFALPNQLRNTIKAMLEKSLERELRECPRLAARMAACDRIHHEILRSA